MTPRLFLTDEAAARKDDREELLAASPDEVAERIESMLTPADAALQAGAGEFHEFFLPCTQAGLAPGSQGWWDDNCMLGPWGFDLADIAVPVLLNPVHDPDCDKRRQPSPASSTSGRPRPRRANPRGFVRLRKGTRA